MIGSPGFTHGDHACIGIACRRVHDHRDRSDDVALGTADLDRTDTCHARQPRAAACPYPRPARRVSTATASAMSLSPLLLLHPRCALCTLLIE